MIECLPVADQVPECLSREMLVGSTTFAARPGKRASAALARKRNSAVIWVTATLHQLARMSPRRILNLPCQPRGYETMQPVAIRNSEGTRGPIPSRRIDRVRRKPISVRVYSQYLKYRIKIS